MERMFFIDAVLPISETASTNNDTQRISYLHFRCRTLNTPEHLAKVILRCIEMSTEFALRKLKSGHLSNAINIRSISKPGFNHSTQLVINDHVIDLPTGLIFTDILQNDELGEPNIFFDTTDKEFKTHLDTNVLLACSQSHPLSTYAWYNFYSNLSFDNKDSFVLESLFNALKAIVKDQSFLNKAAFSNALTTISSETLR